MFKKLKETKAKIEMKAVMMAANGSAAVRNDDGMELVQVLVIVIIAVVLGGLLLATMKDEFKDQLAAVAQKMTGMLS